MNRILKKTVTVILNVLALAGAFIAGLLVRKKEPVKETGTERENRFENEAEKVRKETKEHIASLNERDVADMYPAVWDRVSDGRERLKGRIDEAVRKALDDR